MAYHNKFKTILSDLSIYNYGTNKRYHHVAFLLKGRKKILRATNNYDRCYLNRQKMPSIHAEVNLVKNIKHSVKGFDILVIRVNRSDSKLCDSMPCSACGQYLLNAGFKNVYYSDNNGHIKKLKLKNLREYYSHSWMKVKNNCSNGISERNCC